MDYEIRTTSMTVLPTTESLFSEMATTVSITYEGGTEFLEVDQSVGGNYGKIAITSEEWPHIRQAIDTLIAKCRGEK